MATSPIVLLNSATTVESFTLRSQNGNSEQYLGATSTLAAPELLDFKMEPKGAGITGNDRYLFSLKKALLDSDNMAQISSVTVQCSWSKAPVWTDAERIKLIYIVGSLLGRQAGTEVAGCTNCSGFPSNFAKLLFV